MKLITTYSDENMDQATIFVYPSSLYITTNMMEATGRLIDSTFGAKKECHVLWSDHNTSIIQLEMDPIEADKALESMPFVSKLH